jgi:hypothetical protein
MDLRMFLARQKKNLGKNPRKSLEATDATGVEDNRAIRK